MNHPSNKPKKSSQRDKREKMLYKKVLGNFVVIGSKGEKIVNDILNHDVTLCRMVSLATVISGMSGLPLIRLYKRRKPLMFKWFDENYLVVNECRNWIKLVYQ